MFGCCRAQFLSGVCCHTEMASHPALFVRAAFRICVRPKHRRRQRLSTDGTSITKLLNYTITKFTLRAARCVPHDADHPPARVVVTDLRQPVSNPRRATRRVSYANGIDGPDGAGYSWASALTGRLLPAARESSHLFFVSGAPLPSFSLVSAGHRQI